MMTLPTRVLALIESLRLQLERETPHAPGVLIRAENSAIDDGDYGDPHIDKRPDFVKKDDEGWQS